MKQTSNLIILDYHLFKYQFAELMGSIYTIMDNGEIIYKQSASKIMGKERMNGSFVGSNELGLYLSLIFTLGVAFWMKIKTFPSLRIIAFLLLLFSFVTLIQTYSRVGIAVCLTSCFAYLTFCGKESKIFFYSCFSPNVTYKYILFYFTRS